MNIRKGNYIIISIITGFGLFGFSFPGNKHHTKRNEKSLAVSIVGTWICDSDAAYKIIFPNTNTCQRYDSNSLTETDSVIISNTAPQCSINVPVNSNTNYIQFIDKSDVSRHSCYEIESLTDSSLAIRPVDLSYPAILFTKQ